MDACQFIKRNVSPADCARIPETVQASNLRVPVRSNCGRLINQHKLPACKITFCNQKSMRYETKFT